MCRCCAATYALWRELEAGVRTQAAAHHRHRRDRPAGRRGGGRHARGLAGCTACRTRSWTRPRPCGAFRRSEFPPDYVGVFQPDGGFIAAEPAIAAMIALAQAAGAEIRTSDTRPCRSTPHRRRRAHRDQPGRDRGAHRPSSPPVPGSRSSLPDLPAPLRVTRQVMGWFKPLDPAPFAAGRFPVFLLESRARHALRLPAVRAQARSRSPSTTTATRPSIPTISTAPCPPPTRR